MEALGGAAEMAFFRYGYEIGEAAEFHVEVRVLVVSGCAAPTKADATMTVNRQKRPFGRLKSTTASGCLRPVRFGRLTSSRAETGPSEVNLYDLLDVAICAPYCLIDSFSWFSGPKR